jgi:asparagine synthase (glutamine-hydrolysing)
MMSDVPFGVFLSGGVDSSTNVALMSELMDAPVRTFSVGFERYERYNELGYARTIARKFGTDHHEIVIDSHDLEAFLPELIYHQDEPLADWVAVPLHYVSKLARDNGTVVVQIGEGSDELFHGYQNYRSFARFHSRYRPAFRFFPSRIARAASGLAFRTGKLVPHAQAIEEAAAGRIPFWGGAIAYQGALKDRVLTNGRAHPDSYDVVKRFWNEAGDADLLQKMTYLELKNRLAELLLMRVDKMTMRNSVEARVPFLDSNLVEFALALPPEMKVRNGEGKYLLKKAVSGLLPREIIDRPKQGFSAPVSEWFREDLGERARREIRNSSLAERGLLDYDAIDDLWRAHRAGRGDWAFQLWNIYNVSAWYDYWIAGRVPAG